MSSLVVTLGGKGSSLSSVSVFDVANGLSQVRIDASAFSKLSSSTSHSQLPSFSSSTITTNFHFPDYLTVEESRASLFALLNKLLLSSACSPTVIEHLSNILNRSKGECFTPIDVKDGEGGFSPPNYMVDAAALQGVSALLDHRISALSTVADAVASLSCEALKADISAGFGSLVDSGDGSSDKDQVTVANYFKSLLNGSKLIGKLECH